MIDLFYRKYGKNKPALIILHGLYGSSDNWVSIAKLLQNDFEVFLLDLRNHGNSPHTQTHTYKDLSQDLYNFIEKHNISKAVLLGHSMGGKAVMQFVADNTDVPSAMIIVDISPAAYPLDKIKSGKLEKHKQILEALNDKSILNSNSRQEASEKLAHYIKDIRTRNFILKNLKRNKNNFEWKLNVKVISENIQNILKEVEINDAVSGFPCLFVKGANSDYINKENVKYIYEKFPASEIVEISDAGHWLHAEKQEEFINILKDFLL